MKNKFKMRKILKTNNKFDKNYSINTLINIKKWLMKNIKNLMNKSLKILKECH